MWAEEENQLKRSFTFKDFKAAMVFITRVAEAAEAQNHHPWWSNVYNKVDIALYTHDANNTVTKRDHKLAKAIDAIYEELQQQG